MYLLVLCVLRLSVTDGGPDHLQGKVGQETGCLCQQILVQTFLGMGWHAKIGELSFTLHEAPL